jgi:DNA-binding CsgD family transcriptional regulator
MEYDSVGPAWQRLFELLNDVCLLDDADAMLEELTAHIDRVVPADHGVVLNELRNRLPYCVRWPEYAVALAPQFNRYYNRRCPVGYDHRHHSFGPVTWRRYQDTEYDADFNRPLDLGHSMGIGFPDPAYRREVVITVHRSRSAPGFKEGDIRSLVLLRPLFARIFSLARKSERVGKEHLLPRELLPGSTVLSRREAEVAFLLARRLTMREIAERLAISPRTVERHSQHIYQKLKVKSRGELIYRLTASE